MKTPNRTNTNIQKLLAIAMAGFAVLSAQAQLFQEGFNYTSGGTLVPNGPWTGGNNNLTIGSSDLTYPSLTDLGGNDLSVVSGVSSGAAVANFTGAAITSGTVYYSFLAECTALPTANNYLTSLLPSGSSGPAGSSDPLAVYVGQQTAGSTFKLGIRDGASGATYATSSAFTVDTVNLFVVEYNFTGNVVSLFVNPTPGGSQPTASVTFTGANSVANLQELGFKAQSSASTGNWLFDNLLVGTSWSDVTPLATPEPSALALMGLGGLALAARFRRFRS